MGLVYYETERLIVRQWALSDADVLYGIMSDGRVHAYTSDTPWTRERTEEYIRFMIGKDFKTLEAFHGACVLKCSNQLIGFTGLNPYLPGQPEIEWQLGVPYWGGGYATETGRASIERAFRMGGVTSVYGMANPDNKASMRVMEKIGMSRLGLRDFRGHQDMFYRIDKS